MEKIDYKKKEKQFYLPKRTPEIIEIPKMKFLMVDGQGDPNRSESYQEAIQLLYSLSYTLKFYIKNNRLGPDYTVLPLEGLWWVDNMEDFKTSSKDEWIWTAMIRQPDFMLNDHLSVALELASKKNDHLNFNRIRLEEYIEGLSVQVLYYGPYADEGPTIEKIHNFAFDQGYQLHGKHHEIYLSDPRRTAPEKLKTVIRQPIKSA